jgi:hypothetical protein
VHLGFHSVDGSEAPSIRRQREIDEAEKKVEMVEQLTPMDLAPKTPKWWFPKS